MEMTREEVAKINGGNFFFAAVADELRNDFMQEGMRFCGQGAEASWRESVNLFTKEKQAVLRIEMEGSGARVVLCPSKVDAAFGLQVLVSRGQASYCAGFYSDCLSEYQALEACRLVCVAAFGVEYRE